MLYGPHKKETFSSEEKPRVRKTEEKKIQLDREKEFDLCGLFHTTLRLETKS